MPRMGESIMEATVLNWLKKVGEQVAIDDPIVEVATDKVDTEIPATHAGVITQLLVKEGEVAIIGKPICLLDTLAEAAQHDAPPTEALQVLEAEMTTHSQLLGKVEASASQIVRSSTEARFYSPLVLNICREEQISVQELDTIAGTGAEGRVTKKDILAYVAQRRTSGHVDAPSTVVAAPVSPSVPKINWLNGQDEVIQMDRMRKMIADRMVDSKRTAPHVTSFVECDMINVVKWREQNKAKFLQQYGDNLTYTPLFIEAVVKAIKDFPMINVSVDGDRIIKKRAINIGMAVALPSGNLIVPVIHQADQYSLAGLAQKVNDLSKRARENKLKPDDLADGTYTISNIGTFGNILGTPIILQPQVAIMAFGAIQKKVAVIETPTGDVIGIRQQMYLSHSYDHRVVDGSLGGQFVKRVADYLEKFDLNRSV